MNLAFFASHGGSNMQAVLDACSAGNLTAKPVLLISNNRKCLAIERAVTEALPIRVINRVTHPDPDERDAAMLHELLEHHAELIVLAGYMKHLGPRVIARYRNRILNIHPALLPKFGGQGMYGAFVHQAVIAAKETITGVTVHLVDEEYDHGQILAQTEVPVFPEDDAASLSARVLQREHTFLVEVLSGIVSGQIRLPAAP
ncbi:phosphoribosylglycinamide formyltransferase [Luteolibacter pohnpeiensis]|uniref:Phosphoribosylglycinamide formyltransferase n=1 Tax=Luteolibacter pohnpeiensis TaxID=454153 RepID=A0A934VVN2_9BACT|nr:phosphoribosylglycinamide formyltransferase [Luteolibacter pohnpeiensis]MBK1881978.1 phosphoribosylglycinamide formyltransferase [Luteolibacter pohnpeiensis]